jgi:hypothetical protein
MEMLAAAACWLTVNVCAVPFNGVMEITPERAVNCVFAAAVQFTVPLPAPDAPELIVSHG